MIIFIHGMFMTPKCWDGWLSFFKDKGMAGQAPAWPEHDKSVQELNQNVAANTGLAHLTFLQLIAHYESLIAKLPEKPVLIGHSVGGLIVQVLVNKGLAKAGVAIDSAPPAGVKSYKLSFLRSNFHVVNPFVSARKPYVMKLRKFRYAFANSMPREEQEEAYRTYVVPESIRVPRELQKKAVIDFEKAHAPLLLIAGSADHIIPSSLNRKNYGRYEGGGEGGGSVGAAADSSAKGAGAVGGGSVGGARGGTGGESITAFREFEDRSHTIILQKGWEEVAGFVLEWVRKNGL